MEIIDSYEKLNEPGVWLVRSTQPSLDLCRFVYDLAVELGNPIVVYSSTPTREIQNTIIDAIKNKRIEAATDELERNWLEDELSEYNSHGFFWYPEEMNDYVPNGSFWSNYVSFDEFKVLSFTNTFSNLYLIDNLSELSYDDDNDLQKALPLIEKEANEYKKTLIVFVSPNDTCVNESYIKSHLL